jgi:hypothetical protein
MNFDFFCILKKITFFLRLGSEPDFLFVIKISKFVIKFGKNGKELEENWVKIY